MLSDFTRENKRMGIDCCFVHGIGDFEKASFSITVLCRSSLSIFRKSKGNFLEKLNSGREILLYQRLRY